MSVIFCIFILEYVCCFSTKLCFYYGSGRLLQFLLVQVPPSDYGFWIPMYVLRRENLGSWFTSLSLISDLDRLHRRALGRLSPTSGWWTRGIFDFCPETPLMLVMPLGAHFVHVHWLVCVRVLTSLGINIPLNNEEWELLHHKCSCFSSF